LKTVVASLSISVLLFNMAAIVAAQTPQGATLTVTSGVAGVLRVNGSASQPAPSGMTLGAGDQVATVGQSTALVTFFEGSELEIGWDTTILIREIRTVGNEVHLTVEDVLGTAVARVKAFVNPNSTYSLQSPGGRVVAVVRGSAARMTVFFNGKVMVECIELLPTRPDGCAITVNDASAVGDEDDEEKKEEDKEKDGDGYEESGYQGPAPLTAALVASKLTGGLDTFSVASTLLALGALGWTFYGYLPKRRGNRSSQDSPKREDEGGDPQL
jgi:hypothetical protein